MLELSPAFAEAQKKLLQCDEEIETAQEDRSEDGRTISAFVTFEEWEHCRNVEAAFAGLWHGYLFLPLDYRWAAAKRVRVHRALEPSDLQWHNFSLTSTLYLSFKNKSYDFKIPFLL